MRLVAWNILHGGGQRVAEICLDLAALSPDVVALSEFRQGRGGCLRGALADLGLPHQATLDTVDKHALDASANGLLIASRTELEACENQAETGRIQAVRVAGNEITLVAAHMPDKGQPTARAHAWNSLVGLARTMTCDPAIILGDLNAGRPRVDGTGLTRRDGEVLGRLAALGFEDVFRRLHPDADVASWWSHSGRGYRLDHALANASLMPRLKRAGYGEDAVRRGVSDHAPLVVELSG